MQNANLVLHAGGFAASLQQVNQVNTPIPTKSHMPIPHYALIDAAKSALDAAGIDIVNEQHALKNLGMQYFGLLQLVKRGSVNGKDYACVIGLRNAHDKTYPAAAVMGSQVFVCDNLSFSGEVKIARRHTVWILRDLPGLMLNLIKNLMFRWDEMENRYDIYKAAQIGRAEVDQTLIRAMEHRVIPVTTIPHVLTEWKTPTFDHGDNTVWRLFNSFTQVLKGNSLFELPKRTQGLHLLLDRLVDFKPAPDPENQVIELNPDAAPDVYAAGVEE